MKKLFLYIFLVLMFCNVGFAELSPDFKWKEIGKNEKGDTYFVDDGSIMLEGDELYFLLLRSKKEPYLDVLSIITRFQTDCSKKSLRSTMKIFFDDKIGKGAVLQSNTKIGEWLSTGQFSLYRKIINHVCKQKP